MTEPSCARAMVRASVLGLVLVAVILVGCGDDETTGPTPEANAYAAKLNAAQAKVSEGVSKEIEGVAPSTNEGLARWTERFAAIYGDFSARVQSIIPPADIAALHARLLEAIDRITASLKRAAAKLRGARPGEAADVSAVIEPAALADLEDVLMEINTALGLAEAPADAVAIPPPTTP